MSPSFHKSLNLPLNTDIHTHTARVGWKVQCTWVSRRRKSISQFKKTIMRQSYQKGAQNVNQEHYLCGSFEVRLLPCHYDYCLLIIRATRRRLTYGSCICICICMCTYSVSFLSEQWDIAHARTRVASLPFPGECLQVRWSISLWA